MTMLEDSKLNETVVHRLRNSGIVTVEQLEQIPSSKLIRLRGIGHGSVQLIEDFLGRSPDNPDPEDLKGQVEQLHRLICKLRALVHK